MAMIITKNRKCSFIEDVYIVSYSRSLFLMVFFRGKKKIILFLNIRVQDMDENLWQSRIGLRFFHQTFQMTF